MEEGRKKSTSATGGKRVPWRSVLGLGLVIPLTDATGVSFVRPDFAIAIFFPPKKKKDSQSHRFYRKNNPKYKIKLNI